MDNGNGNDNGKNRLFQNIPIVIVVAVVSQLGFSVWWAAHLDQISINSIERTNGIDAHVTRLDLIGGQKVHENALRIDIISNSIALFEQRLDRLENQNILCDERIKSMQKKVNCN